ncbi:MAG TPA: 3-oxoacyl-[acyl-carrier-protein] synthase III C-terminal domain-containing protein, partial [Dehalococcoidales bacterium]
MAGIKSYGAYIPYRRLPRSVINTAWGRGGGRGERAVAGLDEDSISMAVSASIDCLKGTDPKTVDAVFLATTTPPYIERLNANIVANALDFRRDARNADFANCLRAGTSALLSAMDAVKAGSLKNVLVAVTDMRMGGAGGEDEQMLGDGAAAFLVGNDGVAVEVEGHYNLSDDMVDYWRAEGDTYIRSWEDRFGRDAGYTVTPIEAVKGLLKNLKLTPKDITKACIYGTNTRAQSGLARAMGLAPEQIQDPLLDNVGNTGTALVPMILVSALENAKPGDRILVVDWGNGCDAMVLKVTDGITKVGDRRGIKRHLNIKGLLDNYGKFLRWRNMVALAPLSRPAGGAVSMSAEWRERRLGLPLYGVKCLKCGTVQLYMRGTSMRAHVCLQCQAKDSFEPYRFADKKGKVVSFSHDFLGGGIDPPATRTVVDFEGGGRGLFDMVDRDPAECKVGMDVEMTFRKVRSAPGSNVYFW